MAPKKSAQAPAMPRQTEHIQSDSQDASQDSAMSVATMTGKFGTQMKESTAQRRQAQTMAIKAAQDDRQAKLREDTKACFESHDAQLRGLRRPNIKRLIDLMRKKGELEARIDKSQSELARSLEEAAQQLQVSLEGRVEGLSV